MDQLALLEHTGIITEGSIASSVVSVTQKQLDSVAGVLTPLRKEDKITTKKMTPNSPVV